MSSVNLVYYKQNRLKQLRAFCYAAQTGSVSKAAERLFLSQPSVSLQIQALERELEIVASVWGEQSWSVYMMRLGFAGLLRLSSVRNFMPYRFTKSSVTPRTARFFWTQILSIG